MYDKLEKNMNERQTRKKYKKTETNSERNLLDKESEIQVAGKKCPRKYSSHSKKNFVLNQAFLVEWMSFK